MSIWGPLLGLSLLVALFAAEVAAQGRREARERQEALRASVRAALAGVSEDEFSRAVRQLAEEFNEVARAIGEALLPALQSAAAAFAAFAEAWLPLYQRMCDDELAACGTLWYMEHPEGGRIAAWVRHRGAPDS